MESILRLIIVMLIAGIIGGLMSYFISIEEDSTKLAWWNHVILGIGASFLVPLLLNMLSSNLLREAVGQAPDIPANPLKLFVLAGFCIIAAVSPRAFIKTLSDKILNEVKKANSSAKDAQNKASKALDFLDEKETLDIDDIAEGNNLLKKITENEKNIILEMINGKYSMRSISGLAKNTKLSKSDVNNTLSSLMEKKLIEQGKNSKDLLRWYPSEIGRVIASKLS